MEDHPHGDQVRLREFVGEEVDILAGLDPAFEAGCPDVPFGDRADHRQVERRAGEMRMPRLHLGGEQAGGAADIGMAFERREIELLREGLEIQHADPGHRIHELFEPLGLGIKLLEDRLAIMLDLGLRLAGLQRLGEVGPEGVEAGIRHFQDAADIAGALLDQEECR